MSRILAIDPGTQLGFAWGIDGKLFRSGVYRLPKASDEDEAGVRFASLLRFLYAMITENKIDILYSEAPFIDHPKPGRTPPPRSFKSELLRWGIPAIITTAAAQTGIKAVAVPVGTWRSRLGAPTQAPKQVKGNEERRKWLKAATAARVEKLGYSYATQDEADAIGLWASQIMHEKKIEAQPDLFKTLQL